MKWSKQELEQHREWLKSNIEPLQTKLDQVEAELKKLEEPEFDFKKLMPEGSFWLGYLMFSKIKNGIPDKWGFPLGTYQCNSAKSIYFAHQIVKAAIAYVKNDGEGWHELNDAVLAAEHHNVLQNLE